MAISRGEYLQGLCYVQDLSGIPTPRTRKARKFPELDLMAAIMRDVQAKEARHQRASLRARRR